MGMLHPKHCTSGGTIDAVRRSCFSVGTCGGLSQNPGKYNLKLSQHYGFRVNSFLLELSYAAAMLRFFWRCVLVQSRHQMFS